MKNAGKVSKLKDLDQKKLKEKKMTWRNLAMQRDYTTSKQTHTHPIINSLRKERMLHK